MIDAPEFGKKIQISWGALIMIIVSVFTLTMTWASMSTLESRVDKKHNRQQSEIEESKELVKDLTDRIIELEKCK